MTYKGSLKRAISMVILILFLAIFSVHAVAAAPLADVTNHWAKDEVNYLVEKEIIAGYPDNTYKPQNNVTRAEFYRIINQVIGYTSVAEIHFNDIKQNDWHYNEVAKGVAAGYIFEKSGENIEPNKSITREEVARIIGVTFGLHENAKAAEKFADATQIADWTKGYIGALQTKQIVSGYPDNTFKPQGLITRAEVATIIKNASGEIVNKNGEYKFDVKGNLLVNMSNVILKDTVIEGDLYLTEGVADGDVTFDNISVEGDTYIRGGGEKSITIKNSKLQQLITNKSDGKVRVVIEGKVNVPKIDIKNNTILVINEGVTVDSIAINGQAQIQVQKGATVKLIEANVSGAVIDADGTIEKVKAAEAVNLNGNEVKKGSESKVTEGKISQPSAPLSGGGGGGSGGNSTPVTAAPEADKIFIYQVPGNEDKGYYYQFPQHSILASGTKVSIYKSKNDSAPVLTNVAANGIGGEGVVEGFFDYAPDYTLDGKVYLTFTEPGKSESAKAELNFFILFDDQQTDIAKYDVVSYIEEEVLNIKVYGPDEFFLLRAYDSAESGNLLDAKLYLLEGNLEMNIPISKLEDIEAVYVTVTEFGYQESRKQVIGISRPVFFQEEMVRNLNFSHNPGISLRPNKAQTVTQVVYQATVSGAVYEGNIVEGENGYIFNRIADDFATFELSTQFFNKLGLDVGDELLLDITFSDGVIPERFRIPLPVKIIRM